MEKEPKKTGLSSQETSRQPETASSKEGKPAQAAANAAVAKKTKTKRNPKRNPKGFTPMLRYDSKSKDLKLSLSGSVEGHKTQIKQMSLSLEHLDESARQAVIATAKFVMNYCNGAEVTKPVFAKAKDSNPVPDTEPVSDDLRKAQAFEETKAKLAARYSKVKAE